jgi:hypothetical protein
MLRTGGGRQGQGIVEEDSKGSRGSQRAVELLMMMMMKCGILAQTLAYR